MIAIVDYGMGNIRSVERGFLKELGLNILKGFSEFAKKA